MRFDQINLVVADMDATVEFYELLGLEIPDTIPAFRRHHRSARVGDGLDLDFDSVQFARLWNAGSAPARGGGVVIGFRVTSREEVDETHSRIVDAGHASLQQPYDAFWGARYAVVQDPDGNAVGIMSDRDEARRTTPPTPR
ncbi:MAG: VOC family protein [Actinomycetota bacterium]